MEGSFPGSSENKSGDDEVISFSSFTRRGPGPAHEIPSKKGFSRRKSSAHKLPSPILRWWRNRVKIGASVTTTHVFWPNQRRKATDCYGISNRIQLNRLDLEFTDLDPGRGGRRCKSCAPPRRKTALGIFTLMDPLPCLAAKKKTLAGGVPAP